MTNLQSFRTWRRAAHLTRLCVPRTFAGMTLPGHPRIAVDPAVCGGRPTVAGTRVRVNDVLEMLASGAAQAEILADYPYLTEADIRACLAYAASAADHSVVIAAE